MPRIEGSSSEHANVFSNRIAHTSQKRARTLDVSQTQLTFEQLLLKPPILRGLNEAGFFVPSPIQAKAIPLGRFGTDLIAQAKSGTGKTCVFSIIVLENINLEQCIPQAIIIAPTREIASQIHHVISTIGKHLEGLRCKLFIGGVAVSHDKQSARQCHIAVGTPGRIQDLIDKCVIPTDAVRMFVLDEADQLLSRTDDANFQAQISWILSRLPRRKQTMIFSATFPPGSLNRIITHMRNPRQIRLSSDEPSLEGVKQYYLLVDKCRKPGMSTDELSEVVFLAKVRKLLTLLESIPFHQCVVFSNERERALELVEQLNQNGWPSVCISGDQPQKERDQAVAMLRAFQVRVLVSTDLTARGLDIERISLVINLGLPKNPATYLHRVGRTGRFGTLGVAITIVTVDFGEHRRVGLFADELSTTVSLLKPGDTVSKQFLQTELESKEEEEAFNRLVQAREEKTTANESVRFTMKARGSLKGQSAPKQPKPRPATPATPEEHRTPHPQTYEPFHPDEPVRASPFSARRPQPIQQTQLGMHAYVAATCFLHHFQPSHEVNLL